MATTRFKVNYDVIRSKQAQLSKTKDTGQQRNYWTPKEGRNNIRILSPYSEAGVWYLEVPLHYKIGGKTIVCPNRLPKKGRCYVCEKVKEFRNDKSEELQKLANDLRPKMKVYYNIVDLDHPEAGVQVYGSGVSVFKDLLYYDLDEEWGNITDPDNGYDVILTREGKGLSTQYQIKLKKNSSPIENVVWLDQLNDLDFFASTVLSYDEIKDLYEKGPDDDDGGTSEEPVVIPKRALPGKAVEVVKEEDVPDDIVKPTEEIVDEEKDLTAGDLKGMSLRDLKKLISDNELSIDPDDYDTADLLREAIASEIGLEYGNGDEEIQEVDTPQLKKEEKKEKKAAAVKVPGCFGLEYNEDDLECTRDCTSAEECKKAQKEKKKKR